MGKCVLLSIALLPAPLLAQPERKAQPLAITHVTVIDATGSAAQPDMTVLTSDGRVAALGRTGQVTIPDIAQVVDAKGKFLIPGLWDMHVHWYTKNYLPLFTANGVTGIRLMFGAPVHLAWRKELAQESLLGPRMVLASRIVDGPKPIWPNSIAVATADEGRRAVATSRKEGYDFVKVYSLLPREAYFAIAAEAKKQSIPFAGHVPLSISAADASDAGQRSIEHLTGVLLGCSSQEEELHKELAEMLKRSSSYDRALVRRVEDKCLNSYDEEKAAALFARFAKNGTWQTPTLTVLRAMAYLDDEKFIKDPRLKYLPPGLRAQWNPKNDFRLKNYTKQDFAQSKVVFKKQLELVGAMRRAGVGMLAGTDVLNPFCFPGFSLHDELELLVKAGLTSMEALQAATLNPAKYLDQPKDFGTIEQGKMADLVLLDADPLTDIRNTRKIAAVVVAGKLLDKEELQKKLADVEAAANKKW
jgi:hypothetical protein